VFGLGAYLRALYQLCRAFRKTFSIRPGLYHTGCCYDFNTPLIVTANYHLTVFLLWRTLRRLNVRILVIDTGGINVWCSSGKGNFSAQAIIKQLSRFPAEMLGNNGKLELILPKLSLAGVNLRELRQAGYKPRIGPIYRQDIPEFLESGEAKDMKDARYSFSLRDRLFILPATLLQTGHYALYLAAALYIWHHFFPTGTHWQILPLSLALSLLYVLLFPRLPGRAFTTKAISLYALLALVIITQLSANNSWPEDSYSLLFYSLFTAGFLLFFALSFTGNSGVSNYSLVKREIIRFLPVSAVLLLASLAALIVKGVSQ